MPTPENSKSLSINKHHLTLLLFAVLSIVPVVRLLTQIYLKGDANVFTGNLDAFEDYFLLWGEDKLGTPDTIRLWILFPLGVFYHLLNFLGASPNIMQAAYISLSFFIGLVSFAYLASTLFGLSRTHIPVVVGAIFYMYNPVSVQMTGGRFQFLIAYSLLPLFFALFIRFMRSTRWRLVPLMGLLLSFIFGPNFVFGAVALFVCGIYVVFMHLTSLKRLAVGVGGLLLTTLVALVLSAWWLVPLVSISFFDAGAASDVLTSESFYNRDTSITNVLRGLGDWSFFAKHLGQPYFSYSNAYVSNILVVIGTLVPLGLMFYAVANAPNRTLRKLIGLFVASIILTLLVIGGTHPDWPTSGLFTYMFDAVPQLLIFRNTYKFAMVLILMLALIAVLSLKILEHNGHKRIAYALVPLLFIPAFPILQNVVTQDLNLVRDYPEYWKQATVALNQNDDVDRVLFLPDQYFSVYNWDDEATNLGGQFESSLLDAAVVQNTCDGCARKKSAELIERLVQNYDRPGFSKALQLASITTLVLRNDYATNYYPNIDKVEKVNDALITTEGIKFEESFGELDVYSTEDPLDMIYSPEYLIKTAPTDFFNVFSTFQPDANIALVEEQSELPADSFNRYRSLFYNYDDVVVDERSISETITIDEELGDVELTLDNPDALLNRDNGSAEITINQTSSGSAEQNETIGPLNIENELDEPSSFLFGENLVKTQVLPEDRSYEVGNCRNNSGETELQAITVYEELLDQTVVDISGDRDMACISFGVEELEQDTEFIVDLGYKVLDGGYFGYCLSFDGRRCDQTEIIDDTTQDWQRFNTLFRTDRSNDYKSTRIFIYAPAIYGEPSRVQYQAPAVRKVIRKPTTSITTGASGDISISADLDVGDTQFVPDNDFELDAWVTGERSCALVQDNSRYTSDIVRQDDTNILRLESVNTTACASSERFSIENSSTYVIEIESRVVSGTDWGYCVFSGLSCIATDTITVEDDQWRTTRFLFDGVPSEKNLNLYLYSSRNTNDSEVEFRSASIRRVASHQIPRFSTTNQTTKRITPITLENIVKHDSTRYEMELSMPKTGFGALVFQQSFSEGWRLNINGVALPEQTHFTANSFANAWAIDAQSVCDLTSCRVDGESVYFLGELRFYPQQYARGALIASIASHGAVGLLLLWQVVGIYRSRRSTAE